MTVRDCRNKPLPEGHPFKGALIVFGQKRPATLPGERPDSRPREQPALRDQSEEGAGERQERAGPRADHAKKTDR